MMQLTLNNITANEKARFEKLQNKGMLPSAVLNRLETERRLGIIIEKDETNVSKNKWFYIGIGAIIISILYIYIKNKLTISSTALNNNIQLNTNNQLISNTNDQLISNKISNLNLKILNNISGLDLKALNICINKGLL